MKRYIVHCSVGYAGMDVAEPLLMDDNHTEAELNEACWDLAVNNADRYGYYPPSDDGCEDESDYESDNIEGYPEIYNPDEHDMLRPGGGSFESDFKWMEEKW